MKAADVREALKRKFCAPEYALFFEVGDATGGRARRWADAVAIGLWPSRGLALQGFEIKVSRSDWLSELKQPAKAESIAQYCQYWWLVTPPSIVKEGELPEQWGHYEVQPNGLRVVKAAPMDLSPRTISPEFLAALLRRATETDRKIEREAMDRAIERDREATEKAITERVEWKTRDLRERAETAEAGLKAIYDACGLTQADIGRLFYGHGDFARAVAVVHKLGIAQTYGGIQQIAKQLRPMVEAVEALTQPLADLPEAA